ncbi:MAG: hypothetical protein JWQ40_1772 [Segetibacter sp.]|nr:hypothetical protein [Segetibacter sp.]
MEKHMKTAKFFGGPLDGQTRQVESKLHIYKHEQPPLSEDIRIGEVPIGFFPPIHEYIYEETAQGEGMFFYKEQHHQ